ncbi:MAG: FAD-dependent oxidoreductase [Deltaproteobacteria bacterium]|nr:FAD-dependent oxidoreductase [Deltaproteobacteria bacterium]
MDRRRFMRYVGGVVGAGTVAAGCRTSGGKSEASQTDGLSDYKGPTLPDEYFAPIKYVATNPDAPITLPSGVERRVLVVGGGIAGLSAALELAERGYKVTVKESGPQFGGRLHTRTERLRTGSFRVEHGLHMWFHQYYNFFDILRRLGTLESNFVPFNEVYYEFNNYKPELVTSRGPYPINLLNILKQSPNLNILNAIQTIGAVKDIIFYNHDRNWQQFDNETFAAWGKRTGVNKKFWDIIMEPAASVTLNDPDKISAAEMLLYMHYFFIGNPKAFMRQIPKVDHGTAVIDPWVRALKVRGAVMQVGAPVAGLVFKEGRAVGEVGGSETYDYVVLAADVPGTKKVLAGSKTNDDLSAKALANLKQKVSKMSVAPKYHILRGWFDKPARERPFSHAVIETPQFRPITLIANYGMLEEESMSWAKSANGSIFEFHLYNTPNFSGLGADAIWEQIKPEALKSLPELTEAKPLDFTLGGFENFSSFGVGEGVGRPTPLSARDAGIGNMGLAGDWVALPYPNALMERAVSTGREAANRILLDDNVRQVEVAAAKSHGPGLMPQF